MPKPKAPKTVKPQATKKGDWQDFELHPDVMRRLIFNQGTSLTQAVMELVMNAMDASATRIEFETRTAPCGRLLSLVARDNGRGFDHTQAPEVFRVLGLPHTEAEDRSRSTLFGQFRMGRGQMAQFGVVTWRSGVHCFLVDVQKQGLRFQHTISATPELGCSVELKMYTSFETNEAELKTSVETAGHYLDLAASWNGVPMNIAPPQDTKDWTAITDDFYYREDASNYLQVYNQGVFVERTWRAGLASGGLLVSRKPLAVNMSRNSWLPHVCPVYKQLQKHLTVREEAMPTPAQVCMERVVTPADLREQISRLKQLYAQVDASKMPTRRRYAYLKKFTRALCIPLLDGTIISPEQLARDLGSSSSYAVNGRYANDYCLYLWTQDHAKTRTHAEQLREQRLVFPIDGQALIEAGLLTEELSFRRDKLGCLEGALRKFLDDDTLEACSDNKAARYGFVAPENLAGIAQTQLEGKRLLRDDELPEAQRNWLQAVEPLARYYRRRGLAGEAQALGDNAERLRHDHLSSGHHLRIRVGYSADQNVLAWTDGLTYIAFQQSFVKKYGALWNSDIWHMVWSVYVHELAHARRGGDGHDLQFYRTFHDLVMNRASAGIGCEQAHQAFLKDWSKEGFAELPVKLTAAAKKKLKALVSPSA